MSLTNPTDHAVTIAYHLVNGTAVGGSDFTDGSGGTITIAANQTSANITVNVSTTTCSSCRRPSGHSSTAPPMTRAAPTPRSISRNSTATGNIADNDTPTVAIADGTPDPAIEGSNATITFTVSLTNPADHTVTVAYHLVNGTAVGGSDFTDGSGGTVTILAGQTSANITVNVLNDNVSSCRRRSRSSSTAPPMTWAAPTPRFASADRHRHRQHRRQRHADGCDRRRHAQPGRRGHQPTITFTVSLTNPADHASPSPITW